MLVQILSRSDTVQSAEQRNHFSAAVDDRDARAHSEPHKQMFEYIHDDGFD